MHNKNDQLEFEFEYAAWEERALDELGFDPWYKFRKEVGSRKHKSGRTTKCMLRALWSFHNGEKVLFITADGIRAKIFRQTVEIWASRLGIRVPRPQGLLVGWGTPEDFKNAYRGRSADRIVIVDHTILGE